VSTPAELLFEFRTALDKKLQAEYGKHATWAEAAEPTSDDHHLLAFAKAASVFHPAIDPCAQLRAAADHWHQKYLDLQAQLDQYEPHEEDDVDPLGHHQTIIVEKPGNPPKELVNAAADAKTKWQQKAAEAAECEKQPVLDQICFEMHRVGNKDSYWLCVPHRSASTYLWYEFARKGDGSFVSVAHPKLTSTPYPFWGVRPVIAKTGDWTSGTDYAEFQGLVPGLDPPHWSPVLVMEGTHKVQVEEPVTPGKAHPPKTKKKWIDAPNPPDPAVAKKLHDFMSSPATFGQGVAMIDAARPWNKDLTDRVGKHVWPPITLRGFVHGAAPSGMDYTGDHGTAFIEDGGPSTGFAGTDISWMLLFGPIGLATAATVTEYETASDFFQVHDTNWPGMDWDMHVTADPDVNYLSSVERSGEVEVEIEQFALKPASKRPQIGDWVQVTGRWVFDCGHSGDNGEHYAEIHPPELVVASRLVGDTTQTNVVTTGAWLGSPLSFVVFPPPRPTVTSKLQVSVEIDARKLCNLTWQRWPEENPNHVVCTIMPEEVTEETAPHVQLWPTGLVGMTKRRFVRARIQTFWGEQVAYANIDPAAGGTRVFFRDPDNDSFDWAEVPEHEDLMSPPSYSLTLEPKTYVFRGAGSGWDYDEEPVTLDPGTNHVTLHPTHEKYPAPFGEVPHIDPGALKHLPHPEDEDEWYYLKKAAIETLSEALVQWTLPTPNLSANPPAPLSSGKVQALFVVGLLSWVDDEGTPVPDLDAVLSKPHKTETGAEYYLDIESPFHEETPFIAGRPGPPVAGASVRAQLLLGNEHGSGHAVTQRVVVTNGDGIAAFLVGAGSHPEDVSLRLSVLANPVNEWFTPTVDSPALFFRPGAKSDLDPDRAPYTLLVVGKQLTTAGADINAVKASLAKKSRAGRPWTSIRRPVHLPP
jgi:hypothetical protein